MIGNVFNKWTVIKQVESRDRKKYYLCKCECGTEKEVSGKELRTGKTKQCRDCVWEIFRSDHRKQVGKKYNRWTVINYINIPNDPKKFEARCDCGTTRMQALYDLKSGRSKECERCHVEKFVKRGTTHGMRNTPTYRAWIAMHHRCTNKNDPAYKNYGGRGITVCERWDKFENFYEDMGPRPDGLEIDRIDNNKGYFPGNCRYVTRSENNLNRRDSIKNKPIINMFLSPSWSEKEENRVKLSQLG